MKRFLAVPVTLAALLLAGCVTPPQQPVPLTAASVKSPTVHIGVVMTQPPKVDTEFPGAGCLLCYAAAAAANSSLTSYSHTLSIDEITALKQDVASAIRQGGGDATVIDANLNVEDLPSFNSSAPNIAKQDYTGLRKKYNVEKLIVLRFTALGFERTYSAYVPTAAPKATVRGMGYMVDLNSNTYEWYQAVNVVKASDGEWDESPKYPGLTNAYYQAVEQSRDQLIKPFAN